MSAADSGRRERSGGGDPPAGIPHSTEAEQVVLGCMLLDPGDALPRCLDRLSADHFYDPRHRIVFEQIQKMFQDGGAVDTVTLSEALRAAGLLDRAGGVLYLTELQEVVPTTAHTEHYVNIVRDRYVLRRLLRAAENITRKVRASDEVEPVLDEAEREIFEISEHRVRDQELSIGRALKEAVARIETQLESRSGITGVGTGYPDFDEMTAGLHEGEMIVLAARPSMGKTALAMNIAEHVALYENKPVGIFSLEMSAEQLVTRMLCSLSAARYRVAPEEADRYPPVALSKVRRGMINREEHDSLIHQANNLMKAPIYIDDSASLNVLQLRAKARRMRSQHRVGLIIIDYLQLLQGFVRRSEGRQQEISEISGGIKALAKELGIPIIVLSQLNREVEKRDDHRPRLADLRESGAIEQDADVVALLVRPGFYDDEEQRDSTEAILVIAKQRNGPTGEIRLTFRGQYARFDSVTPEYIAEMEAVEL